jgi:ADP-L-glycero-D-manno-heptose 6-epimerase
MIIVTGAAGFIGSQIAKNLAPLFRDQIIAVDRLQAFHDRKYMDSLAKQLQFIEADAIFLKKLPSLKKVSWIIHMGAITNTAETDLTELKKWNVDYSKAIWNYCTENKVNLIYASSAATYGSGSEGFSDDHETIHKLKPLNPYGKSKQVFDLFALEQKKTPPHWYGVKYFNVYGLNENHKGRMASAIWHGYNEIKKSGAMTLFKSHNPEVKDGDQARDFIYVGDVLKIIDFLLSQMPNNGIYNVGTGHAGTFKELAKSLFTTLEQLEKISWPEKINWIDTPPEFRAAYQYRTVAETTKLRSVGYDDPFTSLDSGVKKYLKTLS